jgi:hypothetical protein
VHRILVCTCVRSISPCMHLDGSLHYEIGIYVELKPRCEDSNVLESRVTSLEGISEVEAVSRGSRRSRQTHNDRTKLWSIGS